MKVKFAPVPSVIVWPLLSVTCHRYEKPAVVSTVLGSVTALSSVIDVPSGLVVTGFVMLAVGTTFVTVITLLAVEMSPTESVVVASTVYVPSSSGVKLKLELVPVAKFVVVVRPCTLVTVQL